MPRDRLKRLVSRSASAVAAVCAAAGLAGLADLPWPFEIAASFQVQVLAAALGCAVVLGAMRRWLWLGVALAGAVPGAAAVLPYWTPGPAAHATGQAGAGEGLRIVLCNVLASNPDRDRVRRFAEESGADILVMQEFDGRWQHDLAGLAARYPHTAATHPSDPIGMAVYSRIPIESFAAPALGPGARPTFVLRLDAGTGPFTLVCTHPRQPLPPAGFAQRNGQLEAVAGLIEALDGPIVVAGDLNSTMWSPCYRKLCAAGRFVNARRGRGVLASWPAFLPPLLRVPIDHVLVSPGITVTGCRLGPAVGSDHLPVIVDVVLP
jgi:endonuclease/exonuclease/phosphatase (EEP) superfamily protein YafD